MSSSSTSIKTNGHPATNQKYGNIPVKGTWEIPRKTFHYSIGFFVFYLYRNGYDPASVYPILFGFLGMVLGAEIMRFSFGWFNRLYCTILGPLMRESEIQKYNGVVFYLAGCVSVLYFFPKDISALSIIYLSWADPSASICGRLWGRFTPKYCNKSLAGTLGAVVVGALVTYLFFGQGVAEFESYNHQISLVWLSLYGGIVAGASEALGGLVKIDDNFTIPVVSAVFLWIPLVGLSGGR